MQELLQPLISITVQVCAFTYFILCVFESHVHTGNGCNLAGLCEKYFYRQIVFIVTCYLYVWYLSRTSVLISGTGYRSGTCSVRTGTGAISRRSTHWATLGLTPQPPQSSITYLTVL